MGNPPLSRRASQAFQYIEGLKVRVSFILRGLKDDQKLAPVLVHAVPFSGVGMMSFLGCYNV